MFRSDRSSALLLGAFVTSALVITLPSAAQALSVDEIDTIAREITVLVNGINPGSGSIIARDGKTYYVLTAKHVVATEDEYEIITSDQQPYKVKAVHRFKDIDLAVVEFESDKDYRVATLANSDKLGNGQTLFVSGWPNPGREIKERIRSLTTGAISSRPETPLPDGYQLVYTNVTRAGMSGGPVLDTAGRIVGVHGRAESENVSQEDSQRLNQSGVSAIASNALRVGFNLGIPINRFLVGAPQNSLFISPKVENTPAEPPSQPIAAGERQDTNNKISDINQTLNTINTGVNLIRNIFRF